VSTALVLGAGGIVGVSYITGALAALEEIAGFDGRDADLVVGTSAGAAVAALLRSGVSASELFRASEGDPTSLLGSNDEESFDQAFLPAFSDPVGFARRSVGSVAALVRAFGLFPVPVPDAVDRWFPAGFFTLSGVVEVLRDVLPTEWPPMPLHLCAVDLDDGRRTVFGASGAPATSVATAMQASCAIPGFYEPVIVDGRRYVDGGVYSTTNLDLAAGYDLVIGVAPMAYDRHTARLSIHPARVAMEIYRLYPTRRLRSEMQAVRRTGGRVLLVRPTVFEAQRHGFNLMDRKDRQKVAAKAYKTMASSLATGRFAAVLSEFGYGISRARSA
jgi:NTE family protein